MTYTKGQKRLGDLVAATTADAYSHDAFGEAEWRKLCRQLIRRGFSMEEAEAIVRSKWTRWARDAKSRSKGYAKDVLDYLDGPAFKSRADLEAKVAELVAGTR